MIEPRLSILVTDLRQLQSRQNKDRRQAEIGEVALSPPPSQGNPVIAYPGLKSGLHSRSFASNSSVLLGQYPDNT